MKCFYCSNVSDIKIKGFCISCGKKLEKICESCDISYEKSANFCMSCGGKLSDLIEKIEEKDDYVEDLPEIKQEDEEIFVLEEVSDDDSVVIETNDISTDKQDIEIEINGSATDEPAGGPELKIEKDSKKASEDSAQSKNESDKRIVSPNAPQNKKSKKEPVQSKGDIDLDSLFNELTSLDGSEQLSAGESSDVPPPEGMSVESVSSNEKDESAFNLKSEKILVKEPDQYFLNPAEVNEKYDVSLDSLINETVTSEFQESCAPMFRKIEERFRICKGGSFYLKGSSGSGKSHIVNRLRSFSEKNAPENGYSIVVSDANIFDFDFMIFIILIKALMKIKSNDVNTVKKKFDKLFGEALPVSKKECLSALICLNFSPVKTKLPKHDIEYLLSYVLYGLSRSKPVLWVINNANTLNVRSIKFFASLNRVFECMPMSVVFVVDPDAAVLGNSVKENIYEFNGFPEDRLIEEVGVVLNTKKIPADLEKLLKDKASGNILFTVQLAEYLKDRGFIFEMKGSWRFSKLPDDFVCPENLDELISLRVDMLPEDVARTLREFTLLNLYEVPKSLFTLVSTTGASCVEELVKKGYLIETKDHLRFTSRSILTALKKKVKIGKQERAFYKELVSKLASTPAEIYQLNKHWLLLSYINLGGIVDRRMNSFLFSSAVYMEKLGFFEISQRSYQTIVSSFESDDTNDDFKILPEIKNARLWRIVEPQWAKIFWEKLVTYAKTRSDYHLELVARGEILLLAEDVDMTTIADIVKKLHMAGCYEEEIGLIDRTTDILVNSGNYLDAVTFATRGYKILRDVIVKYDGKGVSPAEFVYSLYIRCACKLAEVCIMLNDNDKASAILEEALEYAEKYSVSYFKSKILLLLGKIRYAQKDEWEELMKEGFYNAMIGMDFTIIKAFLHFFEENGFEDSEWVSPFIEYKNWINF
ncbi:MAG TPA: zinc ribbon domain-containing protein, partial [bacterium]|nr:zinc ribbon domain-containing protein [bacterium]